MLHYQRRTCRLCERSNIKKVLSLTPTALCDAYVPADRLNEVQEVYPLDLFMCRDCGYVHVPYIVDPEIIYRDYIYTTTSSLGLTKHFEGYCNDVMKKVNPAVDSLVVDVGSNDGTLLQYFKKCNMRVLGIDPATEIAEYATRSGVDTIPDFFTTPVVDQIKTNYGDATVVLMNNLFANVDNLIEMTGNVRRILAPDGVFIVESFYLADLIQNMVFDFIYHEHLSAFSVKPLMNFFNRLNMEIFDVERVPTKGGSLRYYVQHIKGPRAISPTVTELVKHEESIGLDKPETFKAFSEKIDRIKLQLDSMLFNLKSQGKTIAGYGGSATSTTLIYHFGLNKYINYIVDDNPAKHNTFSPGYHIPVLPSEIIYERKPDYIVILAWRFFEPICGKHQAYFDMGGRFIVPLPEIRMIERQQ